MDITNPPQSVDYIKLTTGQLLKAYIINVTDWNMDTTATKSFAHGLGANWTKIRAINAIVYNDTMTDIAIIPWTGNAADPGLVGVGFYAIDAVEITLVRRNGSKFDDTIYDSVGGFVRAKLLVWVEV